MGTHVQHGSLAVPFQERKYATAYLDPPVVHHVDTLCADPTGLYQRAFLYGAAQTPRSNIANEAPKDRQSQQGCCGRETITGLNDRTTLSKVARGHSTRLPLGHTKQSTVPQQRRALLLIGRSDSAKDFPGIGRTSPSQTVLSRRLEWDWVHYFSALYLSGSTKATLGRPNRAGRRSAAIAIKPSDWHTHLQLALMSKPHPLTQVAAGAS